MPRLHHCPNHDSLDRPYSLFQTVARLVQPFLHDRCHLAHFVSTRYIVPLNFTHKFVPSNGESGPPFKHGDSNPPYPPAIIPNGSSVSSAVLRKYMYMVVTNRQIDRQNDDGTRPVNTGRLRYRCDSAKNATCWHHLSHYIAFRQ